MERWLALLAQELLDDPVSTGARFERALATTTVEVPRIAIVTFFAGRYRTIAAAWPYSAFDSALAVATVAITQIAIVALFPKLEQMVATA